MAHLRPVCLLLTAAILPCVTSQIYMPCDVIPVPGCTCWDPERPIVKCQHLNLTWFPRLSPNVSLVHTLDLSHNQLTFVPAGLLSLTSNLRRLMLSHNNIRSVHRQAFQGKEATLEDLDLSHNNLTEVPAQFGAKRGSVRGWRLQTLHLSANKIRTLEGGAFSNLRHLRHLDVEANPIRRVSDTAWRDVEALHELRIGFAKHGQFYLTYLPPGGLRRLETLSVRHAAPQFMGVLQVWLVKLARLRHLTLSGMRLNDGHLTQHSLHNLSHTLHTLSLSHNLLRHVPGQMLASLTALRTLDLSANRIGKFGVKSGQLVPEFLRELDLSRNRLRRVTPAALVRLKQAELIDLSHNNLPGINLNTKWLQALPHAVTLRLGFNPLRCTCLNAGLRTLVERQVSRSNGHLQRQEIERDLRCAPGGQHGNQLVAEVPVSYFTCKRSKHRHGRKKEQHVVKAERTPKPQNVLHPKKLFGWDKPITSIYYNKNIHSYLHSEANVDIPEEIAELLNTPDSA